MKRIKVLLLTVIILMISLSFTGVAYCEEERNIEKSVEEMLSGIDFSELEEYYLSIPEIIKGDGDFSAFLKKIISGEDFANYDSIVSFAVSSLFSGLKEKLPLFITLFALLILSGLLSATISSSNGGVGEIARYAVYIAVVCLLTAITYSLIERGKEIIDKIALGVEKILPVMLGLMAVTGENASATVLSPSLAFISGFSIIIVKTVILPIVVFMTVIGVVSNVNKNIKLKNLFSFCSGSLKWIIGLIITVFSAFLAVKGLSAGAIDNISLRAVKYTVNSSVPIVGGLLKDGFDFIIASAVLIKNSLGVFAIVFIFSSVIGPILEIALLSLGLRFVGAITEPIGDGRAGEFISSITSALNFIVATVIMISFMYLSLIISALSASQAIL